MQVARQKVANFERLVLTDAEAQRDRILEQLKAKRLERLAAAEQEISARYEKKRIREIERLKSKTNEGMAERVAEQKKALLSGREQMAEDIFAAVQAKLLDYITTEEYAQSMQALLAEKGATVEGGFDVVVWAQDPVMQRVAQQSGYVVQVTDEPLLGGCKLKSQQSNMLVDLTFGAKFHQEREAFLERYRLSL